MDRKKMCCGLALLALTGCSTELNRCIDANIERFAAKRQITEEIYEDADVGEIAITGRNLAISELDRVVWARNLKVVNSEAEGMLYLLDEFSIDHSPQERGQFFNGLHTTEGNSALMGRNDPTTEIKGFWPSREFLEEIQVAINTYLPSPATEAERFCNSQGIY